MKTTSVICVALFTIGVLLGLSQLWFTPWSAQLFIKLELTLGALLVVVLVYAFVISENKASKSLQSGERGD